MKMIARTLLLSSALLAATGCAGINHNGNIYSAHGEALHLFGLQIPEDALQAAKKQVPQGASVNTVYCSPSDTSSLVGVLSRILGIGVATIGGTTAETSK